MLTVGFRNVVGALGMGDSFRGGVRRARFAWGVRRGG